MSEKFVVQFYLRANGQVCTNTGQVIDVVRYPHYRGICFYSRKNCDDFVNLTLSTLPFLGAAIGNELVENENRKEIRENPAFNTQNLVSGIIGKWSVRFIERNTDAWVSPTGAYWADFDPDPAICCDTRYEADRYARSCQNLGGARIIDAYVYGPDGHVQKINREYCEIDENGRLNHVNMLMRLVNVAKTRLRF